MKYKYTLAFAALVLGFLSAPQQALAQNTVEASPQPPPVDIMPTMGVKDDEVSYTYDASAHTHPPVKLTPDKSELIRLDEPAGSIIVGNPAHLSILADTSQILVLIPRAPGATFFTILDRNGNVMMQRHAIVASPKEKYIRIRNTCAGAGDECEQTQVFYCPDMCHSIVLSDGEGNSSADSIDLGGSADGGNVDIENITVNAADQNDE